MVYSETCFASSYAVWTLQVTGKLDGADSGLDISVSELDQHLHKVLEVREHSSQCSCQQDSPAVSHRITVQVSWR
jgi:hypothetical protein